MPLRPAKSLLLLLLFAPRLALAFEGLIRFEAKDPKGRVSQLDYLIKGSMLRVEQDNDRLGRLAVVLRDSSGDSLCLIDSKSQFASHLRLRESRTSFSLSPDGKQKTILGQACEHFSLHTAGAPSEVWAVKALGPFHSYESGPFSRAPEPAWAQALIEAGYFPLEIESDRLTLKAIQIQKKSLPDSLFEIPAGYEKVELERLDRP